MGPLLMGLRPSAIPEMPTGNDKFEAAANEAFCAMLLAAGGAAVSAQVYSWLGGPAVGGTAAVVAGVSGLAYAYSCTDWTQPTPTPGDHISGCKKLPPGCMFQVKWEGHTAAGSGLTNGIPQGAYGTLSVTRYESPSPGSPDEFTLTVHADNGYSYSFEQVPANQTPVAVPVDPDNCTCLESFDPTPTYPPFPDLPPHTYTDPDDGCQINVTFEGFVQGSDYNLSPVFKMDPLLPAARADGGIIGGCNFTPIVYVQPPGGGGGTIPPVPIPPDLPQPPDGLPWWWDLAMGALGGIVGDIVGDTIQKAFQSPVPQYTYKMRAACDYKQDGTFEDYTITLPEQTWDTRVLAMQEMQIDFLQQHLLWKTPTCGGGGSPVTGDPVSINWISDEISLASGTRLNKRLVYFDQNGTSLQATVDHWKDFVWQAGPVMVSLNGSPLGKTQVWAATEAEGKRVLEHAAQIAGVDLTGAEYVIGSSKSSRYGVPGTMRVLKRKGILGITMRNGPNGYPVGLPG